MCVRCSSLFAVLTISWLMRASSYTNSVNNSLLDQPTKTCPIDGIPVCGIRDKQLVLFSNDCLLNEVNNKDILQGKTFFKKIPLQHCMQGCEVSCSEMYEPVCARNMKTYKKQLFRNQCELTEYVCKTNMDYLKISMSKCLPRNYLKNYNKLLEKRSFKENTRRPILCTNVFQPVCGSYMGVKSSFKNECLLNAENVVFDRDWRVVNNGMCPQDYSKARRHKAKPTKFHLIKKRSYENNFYNLYQNDHTYNANSFVNDKNQLNISPNDVYVYMPPTFHTQLLKHETSSYQHPVPMHEAYDEILRKIVTIPPADMSIPVEQSKNEIEEPILVKSDFNPLPFAVSRMNSNYLADRSLVHDINQQSITPSIKSLMGESQNGYYYEVEKVDPHVEIEDIKEMPTSTIVSIDTTSNAHVLASTTNKPQVFNTQKQLIVKDLMQKAEECKFGSSAVCAVLANGTVQTFESICEMITANVYLKNTWVKLHDGICEDCKYNCSREYLPVCVTRNGINYTMVNECYYNMGVCMDKKSKWRILSNGECERYSRITDKYANSKPGFPYTSDYFVFETRPMPSSNSSNVTSELYSKSKTHRPNSKRAIALSRRSSSNRCCPRSQDISQIPQDNIECECLSGTTQETSTTLPLHGTQTESHIMRLEKSKDKSNITSTIDR